MMLNQLKSLADEYAKTADGDWLNDFNWCAVPVKFKNLKKDIVRYLLNLHTRIQAKRCNIFFT